MQAAAAVDNAPALGAGPAPDGPQSSVADLSQAAFAAQLQHQVRSVWVPCKAGGDTLCGHPCKHQLAHFPAEVQERAKAAWAAKHNKPTFMDLALSKQGQLSGKFLCVASPYCIEGLEGWLAGAEPELSRDEAHPAPSCYCLICQHNWGIVAQEQAEANAKAEAKDARGRQKQPRNDSRKENSSKVP